MKKKQEEIQPVEAPDSDAESASGTERSDPTRTTDSEVPNQDDAKDEVEGSEDSSQSTELALRPATIPERFPRDVLLLQQLRDSLPEPRLGPELDERVHDDLDNLHDALEPKDARDSIIARLALAATNACMDSYSRAARCGELAAREINLKYAFKGSAHVVDLLDALERRRPRSNEGVTINSVKVEAGAQAVVGRVQMGDRRKALPNPKPLPRPEDGDSDDED